MPFLRKIRLSTLEFCRDTLSCIFSRVLLALSPRLANAIYDNLSHRWLVFLLGHGVFAHPARAFEWTVSLANGKPLRIAVDPFDRFSVGCAFEYKAHDVGLKRTQEFFLDRCDARSLYLDIGANIGVSSIYALSAGRTCWLFEPNTELHSFGKSLYAHNGFTNARWEATALSDTAGEARFFVSRSSFLSSFDKEHAAREGEVKEIVVPMRTLDSYLEEIQSLADELVIKIDVEGHEMKVLSGATKVMATYRPPVMIELLSIDSARREALEYFQALNYVCYGIFDEPQMRLQSISTLPSLVAFQDINFVFLPSEHRLRSELEQHL